MKGPLHYTRRLFDALDNVTSDETAQHSIYSNTRSTEGVYSITSTQSAQSTYRAGKEASSDEPEVEQFEAPERASSDSASSPSIAD